MWDMENIRQHQGSKGRIAATLALGGAVVGAGVTAVGPQPAGAQSPAAHYGMSILNVSQSPAAGPNAYDVTDHGVFGSCAYHSLGVWKAKVASLVNRGYQTIATAVPQSYCGSLGAYKSVAADFVNYMNSHVSRTKLNRYWGGFMYDEEVSFGFSAGECGDLNSYTYNYMHSHSDTGSGQFVWGELGTGSWGSTNYANIINHETLPAPQVYNVYNAYFVDVMVNQGYSLNMITVNTSNSDTSYRTYSQVGPHVGGYPAVILPWGTSGWYNDWHPN
jgi:hypothetical protein